MLKHFLVNYLIILNVNSLSYSFRMILSSCLGENLDKYNLIPSREKLQSSNELIIFENNQDFQQALSAIYSSLLN